jgi:sugar phosphate isomerase/epimerase
MYELGSLLESHSGMETQRMGVKLSLAHLTALNVSPPDLVSLAADCGYDYASLRLTEVTKGDAFPIVTDRAMMRETKARIAATGVGVLDVEVARLTPDAEPESFLPMLEAAAELGAAHLLTQGHDPDGSRLADRYAALCDLAADHGMTADIEFLTWTGLTTLDQAAKLALASGRANAGVMIDTLHFSRSNCAPDEITALPARLFNFIQIADAPAEAPTTVEGLIHTAREARLNPGQGGLDLAAILRALPEGLPISIEIPNARLAAAMPDRQRVSEALAATRELLRDIGRTSS